MIELQQPAEPLLLEAYRDHHPGLNHWGDENFIPARTEVRHTLHREQQGLCVYCEGEIGPDEGHVEHIKSRSRYPERVFDFTNLAHSCDGRKHCGHFKDNNILSIEPRPGCNSFFDLMATDGRLTSAVDLDEEDKKRADATLQILGLNTPKLARLRQQFSTVLRSLASDAECEEFLQTSPFRWSLRGML